MMGRASVRWLLAGRWRSILDTVATLAFIAVAATFIWGTLFNGPGLPRVSARAPSRQPAAKPEPPLPSQPIALDRGAMRGERGARVALIEYSDFQCPYCGKFARETLPGLEAKYVRTGKVLIVFRQFPLPIHALARKAAEGAACAGRQGRFWEMHDQLFLNQALLDDASLRRYARTVGLNGRQFDACLNGEAAEQVRQDAESGKALTVSGTPAFLFGYIQPDRRVKVTERLSGAQPMAAFEAVLERLLGSVPRQ